MIISITSFSAWDYAGAEEVGNYSGADTYKTNPICKNEGHICNKEGRRQLQLLGILVVPRAIAAAVI